MTLSEEQRRDEKRAKRAATAPPKYRAILTKYFTGKASPRTAIKGMCLECVGFDRLAITECTAYACPIWMYRPYQEKDQTL